MKGLVYPSVISLENLDGPSLEYTVEIYIYIICNSASDLIDSKITFPALST